MQSIKPGDNVVVFRDGQKQLESFVWAGSHDVHIFEVLPDDQAGREKSKPQNWDQDGAAPLATDPDEVKSLWTILMRRAEILYPGLKPQVTAPDRTTASPQTDLHLRLPDNRQVLPDWEYQHTAVFTVPSNAHDVRICSSSFRPCDVIGPYVDDRRRFGIIVGRVTLINDENGEVIELSRPESGNGWLEDHSSFPSWIKGRALLPLGDTTPSGARTLRMKILSRDLH